MQRTDVARVTDEEELELTNAALRTLLQGGQSVTLLGRTFVRAQYRQLVERRDELERRIKAKARGGIRLQRMIGRD